MLGNCVPDIGRKVVHVVCYVPLGAYICHDLGRGVEISGEHHIGWDEELIDCPVVIMSGSLDVRIPEDSRIIARSES